MSIASGTLWMVAMYASDAPSGVRQLGVYETKERAEAIAQQVEAMIPTDGDGPLARDRFAERFGTWPNACIGVHVVRVAHEPVDVDDAIGMASWV